MKQIVLFIFYLHLLSMNTASQQFLPNICDSIILTKEQFEKCKNDSIWSGDIVLKINYISSLKTELLPKYKLQRQKIQIPNDLRTLIKQIKRSYDSTLNHKLAVWENEMDKNQKYVQPKAYLSSLLSFQLFKFYPDVYAILLNDIHSKLNPKSSSAHIGNTRKLVDKIIKQIPATLYQELIKITTEFQTEKLKLKKDFPIELFQGDKPDAYIISYNILNFLMWTE